MDAPLTARGAMPAQSKDESTSETQQTPQLKLRASDSAISASRRQPNETGDRPAFPVATSAEPQQIGRQTSPPPKTKEREKSNEEEEEEVAWPRPKPLLMRSRSRLDEVAEELSKVDGPRDDELLGAWLFDGGLQSPVAKRLAAKSVVLQALAVLEEDRDVPNTKQPWIKTQKADLVMAIVIIGYAVLAGIEVEIAVRPIEVSSEAKMVLFVLQVIFMVAFLVELTLHHCADGWRFSSPWHNMSGCFDSLIILLGSAELVVKIVAPDSNVLAGFGVMRLFRLLRLVRIIRVLMVCKELKLLFIGMISSLSAVFWSFILLLSFMYLGTLVCVIMLGERQSLTEFFGSVPMGLFTHFMIVTLEAWPDVADAVIAEDGSIWALYFMAFICMTSLALMNLVTGVVCDKLMGAGSSADEVDSEENQVEAFAKEQQGCLEEINAIFKECDSDESGQVDVNEFAAMISRPDLQDLLTRMDISTDLEVTELFGMLDMDGQGGELSFDQVADGLMRLRGSRHRLHSMILQKDLLVSSRKERAVAREVAKSLREHTTAELEARSASLLQEMEDIRRPLEPLLEMVLGHAHNEAAKSAKTIGESIAGAVQEASADGSVQHELRALRRKELVTTGVSAHAAKADPGQFATQAAADLLVPGAQARLASADIVKAKAEEATAESMPAVEAIAELQGLLITMDGVQDLARTLLSPDPRRVCASAFEDSRYRVAEVQTDGDWPPKVFRALPTPPPPLQVGQSVTL